MKTKCINCGEKEKDHSDGYCDGKWLNEDGSYNENFNKFTTNKSNNVKK